MNCVQKFKPPSTNIVVTGACKLSQHRGLDGYIRRAHLATFSNFIFAKSTLAGRVNFGFPNSHIRLLSINSFQKTLIHKGI